MLNSFTGKELGQNRNRLVIKSHSQEMLATAVPKRPRLKDDCTKVRAATVPRSMSGMQYEIW